MKKRPQLDEAEGANHSRFLERDNTKGTNRHANR